MDIELVTRLASGRGAAPIVLASLVLLPIALVLGATTGWHRRGPTWGELLAPLRVHLPTWGAASHGFGHPVRRSVDRLYGLLVTESGEVVLVRHDRHDQRPYHTLPGGTIGAEDESPGDVLAGHVGREAAWSVREWSLIHVERKGRHQDLVFSGGLASRHLDAARAASRRHLEVVPLTTAALAHVDLHPHDVAQVVRRRAAERETPAQPDA